MATVSCAILMRKSYPICCKRSFYTDDMQAHSWYITTTCPSGKFTFGVFQSTVVCLVFSGPLFVFFSLFLLSLYCMYFFRLQCPGGSMSSVAGLHNNSYKPITNTASVRARLCKLQKGCTRLAGDTAYQLLPHGRWFSPGT